MSHLKASFSLRHKQTSSHFAYTGFIALMLLAVATYYYSNYNNNAKYNNVTIGTTSSRDSLANVTSAKSNFNEISVYKKYDKTVQTLQQHTIRNADEKIHYNLNNKLQLRDEGKTKVQLDPDLDPDPDPYRTMRTFNDGDKIEFVDNDDDDDDDDNNSAKYLKLRNYIEQHDAINTSHQHINLSHTTSTIAQSSSQEGSFVALAEARQPLYAPNDTIRDLLLLHRRKRYLLFPESSSFQMIFDLIIGVVDYTKFAILGITCAIAWELPSKPPSEILEDVRQKLFNGTLGLQRRNDTITDTPAYAINNPFPELTHNNNNRYYAPDNRREPWSISRDRYYSNPPQAAQSFTDNYKPQGNINNDYNYNYNYKYNPPHYRNSYNKIPATPAIADYRYTNERVENNWWSRNQDRLQQRWQQQQQKWATHNTYIPPSKATYNDGVYGRRGRGRKLLTEQPKHRIYSIYGKRRRRKRRQIRRDEDLKLDEIHVREHLRSRDKLLRKIEKVFKTAGHNGTACVLRALCETSHKNRKRRSEPQDFIQEILRAIFTLPQADHSRNINFEWTVARQSNDMGEFHIGQHYLDAHGLYKDCSEHHIDCSHSIWSDKNP